MIIYMLSNDNTNLGRPQLFYCLLWGTCEQVCIYHSFDILKYHVKHPLPFSILEVYHCSESPGFFSSTCFRRPQYTNTTMTESTHSAEHQSCHVKPHHIASADMTDRTWRLMSQWEISSSAVSYKDTLSSKIKINESGTHLLFYIAANENLSTLPTFAKTMIKIDLIHLMIFGFKW